MDSTQQPGAFVVDYGVDLTLREGRDRYFARTGLSADTYTAKWAKFPLGPVNVYMPSPKGRRACVPFHDLNHVLTGYPTTYRGEAAIGGFELGSGCGPYGWAWFLNAQVMLLGVFFFQGTTFRAFIRGRRCRVNLYGGEPLEVLLDARIGEVRARMGLDVDPSPPTGRETVAFVAVAAFILVAHAAVLALPALGVMWLMGAL